jgi:sec-independent protein translocase protein TatA
MWQNISGWHALIILAVIVLIFGAAKLPALARSLGQSVRILRSEAGDKKTPRDGEADSKPDRTLDDGATNP